jgi:hypothetical protein
VLVLAGRAIAPASLHARLQSRASRGPAEFTLLLTDADGPEARAWLLRTVEALRAGGLAVDGRIGPADRARAVAEAWDPQVHDELLEAG